MKILVYIILSTLVNYLVITTIVDIVLMGRLTPRFAPKCRSVQACVSKENHIDLQKANECAGYSTAYLLRHYDIPATGNEVYQAMTDKMADGCVYPRAVKKMLGKYGFDVKYCTGNLNALKNEIAKGKPVIVLIRVVKNKRWLHYVPVVGYDEEALYLAESLPKFVNCDEKEYNRRIGTKEFLALWNTSMLKMPLYRHSFYVVEKQQ